MIFTVIKLRPRGPFHIGEREDWKEGSKTYIPSDTIFSALCHSYLLLYGEVDSLLKGFIDGNPPFIISSAFPYWQQSYFFPVPKNQIPSDKELKKIQFIELIGLRRLLCGERLDDIKGEIKTIPYFDHGGLIFPWKMENVPRVGLSRWTNHPGENFFHFGQVTYQGDAGLFLLIDFKNNSLDEKLLAAFNLLAQEGVGGNRTNGRGLFYKPEVSEIRIDTAEYDGVYSISMYYPSIPEIPGIAKAFYELGDRKGYIYSPSGQSLRRRSIRMFIEGSVFPNDKKRVGTIVDVTPDAFNAHRVYRYGYMFPIPCRLEVI
ncbi:MAG: type III-A CRISPR-associated RAMP protein Csm4 [Syntrophaceae bacterium]|nr:type III-A CRISPR-associated RAMP protein Csm4 [Syntrophaceae bacterium]